MSYEVRLPLFEGPLDLLLYLIEKGRLEITKVSLVAVTDQFLEYLAEMEETPLEVMSRFLVVAARLLLIKSQSLLPQPPEPEDGEEDPGEELARRLLEYKRYKEAAAELGRLEEAGRRAYPRLAVLPHLDVASQLAGLTVEDLAAAFRRALSAQGPEPTAIVEPYAVRLSDMLARLESALEQMGALRFDEHLRGCASRQEVVVSFLALLELIKNRKVVVRQERLFGEIIVYPVAGSPAGEPPS